MPRPAGLGHTSAHAHGCQGALPIETAFLCRTDFMKATIPMKKYMRLWLVGALLTASSCALAAGWVSVLKNTPAERFDDEDLQMFLTSARTALNAEGPPKPVVWANPATGSGGSFLEISHSTGAAGAPCKRLKVSTYAKKFPQRSANYTLCRSSQGKWTFVGAG
jgi:surface antigen